MTDATWWTTVTHGPRGPLPVGPWKSLDEAQETLGRWRIRMDLRLRRGKRVGGFGDTNEFLEARTARLYAYRTRAEARAADISDDRTVVAKETL
ncbi:hypothetical protein [Gordonia otitidis]|uniref:Uncharacterized protein n=1 Tax=Gordonia otitidis (strain DSM 44809 / CCUG 52243 / JCM 12355 / NBRC 100426 / IFM 10032) TaxID=1108044 RepID=H5TIL2_GORO1|nr:hypothetical protein [Gordonia otitidis]GAB33320.1 hypothetical protein GOOTI_062_00130 [Gordonia otitidis NBRC 100426]